MFTHGILCFFSFIGNAVNPAKDVMVVRPSPTKR